MRALTLTVETYERLRTEPTHFAVLPGHQIDAIERVVEEHASTWSWRSTARPRNRSAKPIGVTSNPVTLLLSGYVVGVRRTSRGQRASFGTSPDRGRTDAPKPSIPSEHRGGTKGCSAEPSRSRLLASRPA